jgi:hypothetical protein
LLLCLLFCHLSCFSFLFSSAICLAGVALFAQDGCSDMMSKITRDTPKQKNRLPRLKLDLHSSNGRQLIAIGSKFLG